MFIDWSLYMAHRCLSLQGTPDLWIRLGWLQSSTLNGMKWGALTLLEISHSRGCYLKFAVLLIQRVCSPKWPNTKDPGLCALEAYIAGDTLRHQPMGVGHVTVLQLQLPPCPAMVSPNAGLCKEDKLLYPDHHLIWCTKSGFRPAQQAPALQALKWSKF